jgi:CCR4-NOT complex subunit CAF16
MADAVIDIENLTFFFPGTPEPSLTDVTIRLPRGSRTVLVGANGGAHRCLIDRRDVLIDHTAGKSTLLQILAGKRLTPAGASVLIKDCDVFRNTPDGLAFLGTEWSVRAPPRMRCTFSPVPAGP